MRLDLNQLIQFKKDKIITRYHKDYPHSKMYPEESWVELMKFVWLCHKHQADKQSRPEDKALQFNCVIHAEMSDIDNMWHTFLLFTRDYQQFCLDFLDGVFFHHEPLEEKVQIIPELYEKELTNYLSYIYDNLGEETIIKWFSVGSL